MAGAVGTNFGLNNTLQYNEFYFDSNDTQTPAIGTVASTDWPMFTLARPLSNVAAVKILEVQIPFSYYVFNSNNNTFRLTESGGTGPANVFIPAGNYTTSTIIGVLQSALGAASTTTPTRTYTVSYTASTQKFLITASAGSFTLTFGSTGDTGSTNPRFFLGFPAGDTVSSSTVMNSPNTVNLTGPNYLYVNSNAIGTLCQVYLPAGAHNNGNGGIGPQMAKIPVNVNPGGIINWTDPDPQKWFDLEDLFNFANIDFYLSAGSGDSQNPLQLNGQSFSLKLGVLFNQKNHTDLIGSYEGLGSSKRIRPN